MHASSTEGGSTKAILLADLVEIKGLCPVSELVYNSKYFNLVKLVQSEAIKLLAKPLDKSMLSSSSSELALGLKISSTVISWLNSK